MRSLAVLLLLLGMLVTVAWLEGRAERTFEGRFGVADGDSLVWGSQRLRLEGIDAPELDQQCTVAGRTTPCGRKARAALRTLLGRGGTVCRSTGLDRYDRWLVRCTDEAGELAEQLVEQGWAVAYGRFEEAEDRARRAGRGLWAGTFERPEEYRRATRGDAVEVQTGVSRLWRGVRLLWQRIGGSQTRDASP